MANRTIHRYSICTFPITRVYTTNMVSNEDPVDCCKKLNRRVQKIIITPMSWEIIYKKWTGIEKRICSKLDVEELQSKTLHLLDFHEKCLPYDEYSMIRLENGRNCGIMEIKDRLDGFTGKVIVLAGDHIINTKNEHIKVKIDDEIRRLITYADNNKYLIKKSKNNESTIEYEIDMEDYDG